MLLLFLSLLLQAVSLETETSSKPTFYFLLCSYGNTFIDLFWLLLGQVEEDKIEVKDPEFYLTAVFGRVFFIVYVICMVIVGLNMLIAMMNNSYERIMVRVKLNYIHKNFHL